ncbi:alcohol dehydrogenase catalytic domain-containing protein [Kineosporia sp. J2-2]|uniref:Alcohol dehydrogenase catalytic domain-containing protein n=1 Tax=Kineosporia corallincola TaxID=2835133 RepID=A0ABS5TMG5_9ACTN|nr:alcohol dehydrogenase catalytic domain-containing protein [Kineosporia corallincola]MBT0772287.1 alcohol dehydrogenase catalytic domain-containing protein [Kineosporia corallincola]
MRAVVFEAFGDVPQVREVPDPQAPVGGVVVAVEATGLCRSDWHALAGHDDDVVLPHVPGHEFAGRVLEIGQGVSGFEIGQRVTAPFVYACGVCAPCRQGDGQVCLDQRQPGFTRWGSFAGRVVVERAMVNLVPLPDQVPMDVAAVLGCRFGTSFRAVTQVGRVRAGEWVAVHGCGGVGLSAVAIAVAAGARVVAVDVSPRALELAVKLGAESVVQARGAERPAVVPADDFDALAMAVGVAVRGAVPGRADTGPAPDVPALIRDLTAGGAHLSLDALGSHETCANSIQSLRPRGRHVQVGLLPPALGLPPVPMHTVIGRELEVLGSHGLAAHAYPQLMALVASGRLDPSSMITTHLTLDEAGPALAAMDTQPPSGVAVIDPRR